MEEAPYKLRHPFVSLLVRFDFRGHNVSVAVMGIWQKLMKFLS